MGIHSSESALHKPAGGLVRICVLALAMLAFPAQAGRAPSPEAAEERVQDLLRAVVEGIPAKSVYLWFSQPSPQLAGPTGIRIDRERLSSALQHDGPLGRILVDQPPVAATVMGPDYARVVLATSPHLSFVLRREGGRPVITRWEVTSCGACREPRRFVQDLLTQVREDGTPRLVPGLDLQLGRPGSELEGQRDLWRHAFQARNITAGYLRWLLQDAQVLGVELEGVRVSLRDRVETWPVAYRDKRWALQYERLPPDSLLRLDQQHVDQWRDEALVRDKALEWWLPWQRRTADGGRLLTDHVVAVAWQEVEQRWVLVLQRSDRRIAALVGLEPDGTVSQRLPLPSWPDRLPSPVRRWTRAWTASFAPSGDRLLLAAAGRWWFVSPRDGSARSGPRGVLGEIRAATWAPDGSLVALGDDRGNMGLIDARSGQPRQLRYARAIAGAAPGAISGLELTDGGAGLLVAWSKGHLQHFAVPELEPRGEVQEVCCGSALGMDVRSLSGDALVACGGACPPMAASRVSLVGRPQQEQFGDALLGEGGVVSGSPDGRWVVLAGDQAGRCAALCRSEDLGPVRFFSEVPLEQVVWNSTGSALLALRADGSAVLWELENLLRYSQPPSKG